MSANSTFPDFHAPAFLRDHIARTLAFYRHARDTAGGFFHYFRDDGSVYDTDHRHLVSSTRFVYNYAMAAIEFGAPQHDAQQAQRLAQISSPAIQEAERAAAAGEYHALARHGLHYLCTVHRNRSDGGYFWTLRVGQPEDRTHHAYGTAFVLLAYATALKAGIAEAADWLEETWDLLERHYWEPAAQLYRDEASSDWQFSPYRGQNANMHLCEAMIAAYQASQEVRYLNRALTLADGITRRQAALAHGLVWEHYTEDWQIDWDYHRDDPKHLFRPWGFQPGHQTEWAKLLVLLDDELAQRQDRRDWLIPTARQLFETAVATAWDQKHGGLCYGFDPTGAVCDNDKYFWVQAESLAAAALLHLRTGAAEYDRCYQRLWEYAWTHFVDHQQGAWYRILTRDNRKYSNAKSPAGKTDYHTMGACHEVLRWLRRAKA